VNSRVYDAIAAGCLVLTNNGRGAAETFEGLLPVYTDRESLTELLKLYLGDETLRQKKVQEMQRFVLANHTYELRAAQLEEMLREYRTEGEEKA
jgi:spore maturation protein CgeB